MIKFVESENTNALKSIVKSIDDLELWQMATLKKGRYNGFSLADVLDALGMGTTDSVCSFSRGGSVEVLEAKGVLMFNNLIREQLIKRESLNQIVVPKAFENWYEEILRERPESGKMFAIWKIANQGFNCGLKDAFNIEVSDEKLSKWTQDNSELAIRAVLLDEYVVRKGE